MCACVRMGCVCAPANKSLIDRSIDQPNPHHQPFIPFNNSLEDVHTAIATLKAAGFENWSVDLIGGLPGQVGGWACLLCVWCVWWGKEAREGEGNWWIHVQPPGPN